MQRSSTGQEMANKICVQHLNMLNPGLGFQRSRIRPESKHAKGSRTVTVFYHQHPKTYYTHYTA